MRRPSGVMLIFRPAPLNSCTLSGSVRSNCCRTGAPTGAAARLAYTAAPMATSVAVPAIACQPRTARDGAAPPRGSNGSGAASSTRAPLSASANACAVGKRSAGSFASAASTARSTCTGTVSRTLRGDTGRSVSTRATIACTLEPVNGGSPVSISYVTAPSAYTSARASMVRSPIACSGAMYCGVPSDRPVCVMRCPPALCTARAMPKSATTARPDCSRMFSGLMSRCTTPFEWASDKASATSCAMRSASAIGSWRSRSSRARSVSPVTSGIT